MYISHSHACIQCPDYQNALYFGPKIFCKKKNLLKCLADDILENASFHTVCTYMISKWYTKTFLKLTLYRECPRYPHL